MVYPVFEKKLAVAIVGDSFQGHDIDRVTAAIDEFVP